ncbi:hypothetical protein AWZ03_005516 [Drosophila navojoa]|uniref:Uncharacterized protein n=1 Tax=Drosophila navojoa TaxID=7232 RepID=A0A484BH51_DRONA|nr:PDZ and LIM domain protein Zasp [Drosophila navojoa]TDG48099.1 hypothetical protein AWZ03_005516 [Drosophila navojoa]
MSHKKSVVVLLLFFGLALHSSAVRADVSHLDYSISASPQLGAYHYPVPRAPQRAQQHVARQFVEPALEHAAFTQVLTSRGYVFGGNAAPIAAALTAPAPAPAPAPVPAAAPSAAVATGRAIATHSDSNSLNLKLPVPFGLMPLNVANLPLQAGASYATVPHTTGLTSYGTAQIQRR